MVIVHQTEGRRFHPARSHLWHGPQRRQRLRIHFQQSGHRLAWTIDAEEKIGNGISVRDLKTDNVTPIDSGKATYEKVAWSEDGDAFAVLKGVEDKAYEDKLYSVVAVLVS